MRPLTFGAQTCQDPIAEQKFAEIERASRENDPQAIAQEYETGTYTELRTINVGTSTLTQTQQVLASLLDDLARGGSKRTAG